MEYILEDEKQNGGFGGQSGSMEDIPLMLLIAAMGIIPH
jgi:hypothetical protein